MLKVYPGTEFATPTCVSHMICKGCNFHWFKELWASQAGGPACKWMASIGHSPDYPADGFLPTRVEGYYRVSTDNRVVSAHCTDDESYSDNSWSCRAWKGYACTTGEWPPINTPECFAGTFHLRLTTGWLGTCPG